MDQLSIVKESGGVKDVSILVNEADEGSDRRSGPGDFVYGF